MSETPGWLTLPTMVHREDLDKAVAAVKDLRGQRDEAINELTSALEILSVKRDAAEVEWRRLFDAMGELLNELGPDFDQGRRAYYDEMTALSQIAMGRDQAMSPHADIAKIFDHKWLDPQCIETGCQSLILRAALNQAEAEKADFRRLDDAGYAKIATLRAELAAVQETKKMNDFNLSQHKMVTMDRFHKIQRLEAELAAMREALEKIVRGGFLTWGAPIDIARTALQSHRRTET